MFQGQQAPLPVRELARTRLDIDTANFLSHEDLCERARKGAFFEILISFLRVALEG